MGIAVPKGDSTVNVQVGDSFVFLAAPSSEPLSQGEIAMNGLQRKCASFTLNQSVPVSVFIPSGEVALSSITINLDLLVKKAATNSGPLTLDHDELVASFKLQFGSQVFAIRQQLAMDFNGLKLDLIIDSLEHADLNLEPSAASKATNSSSSRGQVLAVTNVFFKRQPGSLTPIVFTGTTAGPSRNDSLFKKEFNFENLGIGGLGDQFSTMFRRAFASRIFPGLVKQLGINHVRGMLLYGPPGCGKTLIARQIGKVLNAREPKIVNGPEVLDKFVGGSEEKIRKRTITSCLAAFSFPGPLILYTTLYSR